MQWKMITENALFQQRSLEWRFLKTSAFLLRVDGRKQFRIRNTMMSYIIYFQHNACSIIKLLYFHRFSVLVWTGDYDSMLRVVAYLFENGGKISVIKNIRIHVDGQNLLLFCHCRRWLGFLITVWPIFVHPRLFHVFLFPLCLLFSFTLEKGWF